MVEQRTVFYTRRIIFLLVALAVAIPLVVKVQLPMFVGWPTKRLYDAIEKLPPDKLVVVSANWSAGTQGETAPQTEALIRHLAQRHQRFAIWGWLYPQGPELAGTIAERIAKEYRLEYGVDWVNWGFKTGSDQMVRGWAKDIPGTIKEDIKHTPINKLSITQFTRSHEDIGIIIEITGSNSVPVYIRYLNGVYGTPIGYACTGVMVPEAFPYLDANQIVGMLRGLAGAAEYEELVKHPGDATRRMSSQSFTHLLIILLIILGNIGYFMKRKASRPNGSDQPLSGEQPS